MAKQVETFNILRDGILVAMRVENTLAWFHKHTSQSQDWMCEHEGYSVETYHNHVSAIHGRKARCAETGKVFTIEPDGCSCNYASNEAGDIISDEGVNIRERRELLDTSKPFYAYVGTSHPAFTGDASVPRTITGWKGNVLMRVTSSRKIRLTRQSYTHGRHIYTITAIDANGQQWYGRGNAGICIKMRAYKGKASK